MTVVSNTQVEEKDIEDTGEANLAQFVTFFLGKECFAFPMSSVLEIIRVPRTVPVPLTSRGLVGLTNLRGEILSVVDLRKSLGLPERAFDDTTRAIVVDCGQPIALMVDRVSSVLDVESTAVEPEIQSSSIFDTNLLTGVLKNIDGHDLIQIIDVDKTVAHEFSALTQKEKSSNDTLSVTSHNGFDIDEDDSDDSTAQYVSLLVNNQEYAFDISQVDEIVRVPDEIVEVPNTRAHVLGLISLRERLLPLVGLRRMFQLPDEELTEHHRIIVVRFADGGESHDERIGVVVDHVREVLRVPHDEHTGMPELLRENGAKEVKSVCQLENGKRLVGVLSFDTLFDHPAIKEAREVNQENQQDDADQGEADDPGQQQEADMEDHEMEADDNQMVIYQLAGEEFGVPISFVQEIIRVPTEMTEVPKTAGYIEGMINLRGVVLPVVDMRKRFEVVTDTDLQTDRQRILVLNVDEMQTGFIVDSVTEVLRLPEEAIEESPELSAEQKRLIGRVAKLDGGNRIVQVLGAQQLMSSDENLAEFAA